MLWSILTYFFLSESTVCLTDRSSLKKMKLPIPSDLTIQDSPGPIALATVGACRKGQLPGLIQMFA